MEDLNIVIAGAAGEGVQTIGDLLSEALAVQGYGVFTWKEYESRIRGGQNRYTIRISEVPRNAPLTRADVLLALNNGAADKYKRLLKKKGILLAQRQYNERTIVIPFHEIAEKEFGKKIYANTIATGALVGILGMTLESLRGVLTHIFSRKKAEVLKDNFKAAEMGFTIAEQDCQGMCPWKLPGQQSRHYLITGNEAIPLAAAYAGCRFIAAYPMTPSTGIITYLSKEQERLGVFVEQAEDEIAAINMAIGASYAGVRAMTATSGGGFALMVEGISLAGMTETPLVIILAQRPGPATGLPTRTAQGDLLFSINAGHGEFPKMILAPSDPQDAFHKTVRAFNLAEAYQIPVIILTDQFLADSRFSHESFDLEKSSPVYHRADPSKIKNYKRYRLTDDGISPRLYPGQSEQLVHADSDEHDEYGHITEDLLHSAKAMAEKRSLKFKRLKENVMPPQEVGLDDSDIILVGWGSTRGALLEAASLMTQDGKRAGMIHFTELWPLPGYQFPDGKDLWVVENNASGQLARLLRSEYGVDFKGAINRYDGLPLTGNYIRSWLNDKN